MQAYGSQLKDFYQRELVTLREDAQAFAQTHPVEAAALGLGNAGTRDPQVEMLMQAFAFLTGRVLYEMEASKAVLANALLADLYPHLAAPLPCMAVAQVQVKPEGANGALLERGRQAHATATDDQGNLAVCKFRTTCALPLTPLSVTEAELLQPEAFPPHIQDEATLSALRVRVLRLGDEPIKALKNRSLRFYIDPRQKNAYYLHELLAVNLRGISLSSADDAGITRMQPLHLRWLGFSEEESALPGRPNMHPGHRLLQEYFACPEKFMFFETAALDDLGKLQKPVEKSLLLAQCPGLRSRLPLRRAWQWRHISPTPTLRFFLADSSARASIFRVLGPSTVTGFSMKTLTPF